MSAYHPIQSFRTGIKNCPIRTLGLTLLPVTILWLSSCGKKDATWRGSIQVVNGVTIVKNPNRGIWDSDGRTVVTLVKEGQVGALEGPPEATFADISDLEVDGQGNIYVADRKLDEIRKFSKDGKHLLTFGRKGQGPGEFQSIKVLSINSRGEVIAFDDMAGRVSVFSGNGELLKTTKQLLETEGIEPSRIFCSDSGYVFFGQKGNDLQLFHEFGYDWKWTGSYVQYEFLDNREFEKIYFGFSPGYCDFQNSNAILYTKYFYDNRILVYQNKKLARVIERESDIKRPYSVQVFHDVNKAMAMQTQYELALFGRGIAFLGQAFQTSLGVYRLPEGKIANFISIRKAKDLRELGVELYDDSGKLLSYSVLGQKLDYDIRRMDSSGLFYAIERKDFPKFVMFRLKIDQNPGH